MKNLVNPIHILFFQNFWLVMSNKTYSSIYYKKKSFNTTIMAFPTTERAFHTEKSIKRTASSNLCFNK